VRDFRRILEDKSVDILSIAAPNFWHAPATILACSAGKHVYVEKPGSQTAQEAEWMVQSARTHKRQVQMGNQRRSMPEVIEAMQKLREGAIGPVRFARCWYNNARGSIGRGKPAPVPAWLDWDLWQGPAPEQPFKDNLVHYNWHWHWHYGGGELANNGVHAIDLARWGLGVDYAQQVTCNGGRYHFDDDQETPDTTLATYHFGEKGLSWDGSSCAPRRHERLPFVSFYGDGGVLELGGGASYKILDIQGKEIHTASAPAAELPHFQNLADAIRNGTKLNAEIGDAQISTMLCHLGNIAWRSGRMLKTDSRTGRILDDAKAMQLWTREYRPGWQPKV
jgi:predicted dehydrogenase